MLQLRSTWSSPGTLFTLLTAETGQKKSGEIHPEGEAFEKGERLCRSHFTKGLLDLQAKGDADKPALVASESEGLKK